MRECFQIKERSWLEMTQNLKAKDTTQDQPDFGACLTTPLLTHEYHMASAAT